MNILKQVRAAADTIRTPRGLQHSRSRLFGTLVACVGLLAMLCDSARAQETGSSATLLAEWQAHGGAPDIDAAGAVLLPVGAELVRTLPAGGASVRLLSRPYFGVAPADWASLEVGPASLTFVRDPSGGGLVLLGDRALPLPFSVALGEDGRSLQPLDLTLLFDQTAASAFLQIRGESFNLPVTGGQGPVTVVIAAGAASPWSLAALEARSVPDSPGMTPAVGVAIPAGSQTPAETSSEPNRARLAAERLEAYNAAKSLFKAGDTAAAEAALLRTNESSPGTFEWQLESAGKLTHLALNLRQQYDYPRAIALARRVLELLEKAAQLGLEANPRQRASVHEMAAFVQEELLRDQSAAREAYVKARQIDGTSKRALRGLADLDNAAAKTERLRSPR